MALKKVTEVLGGQASGEYWRLMNIVLDFSGADTIAHANFALFGTEVKADEGAPPLANHSVTFTPAETKGDIRDAAYAALKADPAFSGAEDA